MNQAGIVLVAVAALWIAYLVPHRSRYRQQLLESRADDRFSEHLRVLRVAHAAGRRSGAVPITSPGTALGTAPDTAPTAGTHRTSGVRLHPARRPGGGHMDRPHGTTDRVVADAARRTAAERAQRVAHLARRRAAARRRALLTGVLLVAGVIGWSVVAATGATVLLGVVPSLGLVAVLGLGRAAVRAGVRADEQWAAGASSRVALPGAGEGARTVGRSVHPSDARTEVLARVPLQRAAGPAPAAAPVVQHEPVAVPTQRSEPDATVEATAAVDDDAAARPRTVPQRTSAWSPVPVPPPSYTLKPSAPRREPAPLPADEHLAASSSAAGRESGDAPASDGVAAASTTPPARPDADPATSLDLDAILARRRASGE
ncbi:hypothetical protein [Actinotalea sp. Marseille-Q4924]|uniref:hypothetical protein n=1 Tax=Actinotalea sp. Marseille-Q4924 TaxID=2866571 RepID=UPI001CE43106|nr:hypothetical protein [Actinotalea sp. Marseille-Q4924]